MSSSRTSYREGMDRSASSDALLAAVIEISDDAIITFDVHQRITSWGTSAMRLFGRSANEALGQTIDALFAEHLRAGVRVMTGRAMAGELIWRFESEILRTDGMPMPVSLSIRPILDVGGIPVAAVVIVRDVTEQVLAQAALAEVEGRLQEGEALAHVGSWLWDLRTGAVQWSAEFHRIHGVDPLAFEGTFESFLSVILAEDRDRVRAAMEGSVASGRAFQDEYRVETVDQQVRTVHIRAQPTVGSAGSVVGLRGWVRTSLGGQNGDSCCGGARYVNRVRRDVDLVVLDEAPDPGDQVPPRLGRCVLALHDRGQLAKRGAQLCSSGG